MNLPDSFATPPETTATVDRFGRRITYLRLSVTDRCNFRCAYCMSEDARFVPQDRLMSLEECETLVRAFAPLGVDKVRITGGEPLLRKNLVWLLERLTQVAGLREVVLTTNGSQLGRHAVALFNAGIRRINVSLDSLDPDKFRRITGSGDLAMVLRGIDSARSAGIERIKINTVMIRGGNDDELVGLVSWAIRERVDITFIEEMPVGAVAGRMPRHLAAEEARALLERVFHLKPCAESSGGPASYWRVWGASTRVGFISPQRHDFCAGCNRVRVSAEGLLFPCLGSDNALPLLPALRRGDPEVLRRAIVDGISGKPAGHHFEPGTVMPAVIRPMYASGG